MKKITTILFCTMLMQYCTTKAQSLAINTTGAAANTSAMLDITSISKGLLIPRLTTTQRTSIVSPGKGLLVYDSTLKFFYFHNGIVWQQIITDSNNLWRKNGTGIYNANTGNVGIGIAMAQSLLHVKGGAVLFDSTIGSTPVNGPGTRMMWIPEKRAFRVGEVIGSEWDDFNIGLNSMAMGYSTTAFGSNSTAIGYNTIASGTNSIAIGNGSEANGANSIAMGSFVFAGGTTSIAMGDLTNASGSTSIAMGFGTSASGDLSTAMGIETTSKAFGGFVAGLFNDGTSAASATSINPLNRIFQIGNGTTNAARSNALTVLQNGNIGIGLLNPQVPLSFPSTPGNKISLWGSSSSSHYGMGMQPNLLQIYCFNNLDNIAFGYGSSAAFTELMRIKGSGDVGIGTPLPTAKLSVNGGANNLFGAWGIFSDERIKTISGDFTDGLNVIRQIQPVNFVYNDKAPFKSDDAQIGIVAQDLEKIAPYMVSQQSYQQFTDLREVNNQAYTFLLINAVKEQQVQIESQQKENREQKERIDKLEKLVNKLTKKVK
jgi:hypothetical protein